METSFPVELPSVECWSGDTTILGAVTLYEGPVTDNVRVQLGGWTDWKAQWRPKKISKRAVDLNVEVNSVQGTVIVTAPATATDQMGVSGVWDVQATKEDGSETRTWFWGKTKWTLDVTR